MTGELRPRHQPSMPSEQSFGRLFGAIFLVFAIVGAVKGKPSQATVCAALAVALFVVSQFRPAWLRWPNLLWFRLGKLLASVVNPIVLGVIFFLLLTPLALLMRMFGRDALRLRLAADADSYWIPRANPPPADSFNNQF